MFPKSLKGCLRNLAGAFVLKLDYKIQVWLKSDRNSRDSLSEDLQMLKQNVVEKSETYILQFLR
jgi:hypothetical protein